MSASRKGMAGAGTGSARKSAVRTGQHRDPANGPGTTSAHQLWLAMTRNRPCIAAQADRVNLRRVSPSDVETCAPALITTVRIGH